MDKEWSVTNVMVTFSYHFLKDIFQTAFSSSKAGREPELA